MCTIYRSTIFKITNYDNSKVYYGKTKQYIKNKEAILNHHYRRYKKGKEEYKKVYGILKYNYNFEEVGNFRHGSKEEINDLLNHFIKYNDCINKE